MTARKINVTGIKYLSIGSTKNGKGHRLTRYTVNYKGKATSFYFGFNQRQRVAFDSACDYLEGVSGQIIENRTSIFDEYKHTSLV